MGGKLTILSIPFSQLAPLQLCLCPSILTRDGELFLYRIGGRLQVVFR